MDICCHEHRTISNIFSRNSPENRPQNNGFQPFCAWDPYEIHRRGEVPNIQQIQLQTTRRVENLPVVAQDGLIFRMGMVISYGDRVLHENHEM